MIDEGKGKIHIKPKSPKDGLRPGGGGGNAGPNKKDWEEHVKEFKKMKKQVGRLLNIAEHEENIVEENQGKQMVLKLIDGSEEKGELKDITKFQIILDQAGIENHFYKSSIIKYHFT